MPRKEKLPADVAELQLLLRAKEANRILFLSKPHVIGLNVGYRIRGGNTTDERAVIVYVSRKLPESLLRSDHLIPKTVTIDDQDVPVDVVESAIPKLLSGFSLRCRPLRGGMSIGIVSTRNGGTGGVCVTRNNGKAYILSCRHVLNGNIGDAIVQPGLFDGGSAPDDVVGILADFVPLDFGQTTVTLFGHTYTIPNSNYVDAALAQITDGYNVGNREIHWIGYPHPLRRCPTNSLGSRFELLGLMISQRKVCKMGCASGFTIGTVIWAFWEGFLSGAAGGNLWFVNQLVVLGQDGPFVVGGDSGALVVDFETGTPIGLVVGGNRDQAFVSPIQEVMNRLNIPQI